MAIKSLAQTLKDLATGIKNTVTGVTGSNATLTITKGDGTTSTINLIPAGTMQMFAGNTIPAGWLLCDGSAISRTGYAKLFSAIGTIYGAGDGSTTFALPNLIDRVIQGAATAGTYKNAGLPNILAYVQGVNDSATAQFLGEGVTAGGAWYIGATTNRWGITDGGSNAPGGVQRLNMDASRSNTIYGNSTTVQPPALTMLPIIKY